MMVWLSLLTVFQFNNESYFLQTQNINFMVVDIFFFIAIFFFQCPLRGATGKFLDKPAPVDNIHVAKHWHFTQTMYVSLLSVQFYWLYMYMKYGLSYPLTYFVSKISTGLKPEIRT